MTALTEGQENLHLAEARPLTSVRRSVNCFDVFETLLTRAVLLHQDVHLLLGRRLQQRGLISLGPEAFARQRRLAEARAGQILGAHPPLAAIYRELAQSLSRGGAELAEALAAEEVGLERALSRKVPGAELLVREARGPGNDPIVFVTDINLSTATIRELLQHHWLWQPQDIIFTSCECGVDKGRGLMFPHVAAALGLQPRNLCLHGNDPVSDIRNGRLSGWRVRHLTRGNPNRYEQELAAHSSSTEGLASLFAGASRLARLARPVADEREQVLTEVAAGVMGPTMTAWTMWVMRRAVEAGCSRVYFLSRDGQVSLEIARRLESVLKTGLDLRYLFGSRRAMNMACAPERTMRDMLAREICSLADIAALLQVSAVDLVGHLPQLRNVPGKQNLAAPERRLVTEALETGSLGELTAAASQQTRALLLDYLRQEGWSDGVTFAVVDIGWRGSTARALTDLTEGTDVNRPRKWLFFGLGDNSREVAGPVASPALEAWFFDAAARLGYLPPIANCPALVEMFCAGDHGAVEGYARRDRGIEPVLRTAQSPMQGWGLPILRRTTMHFVDEICEVIQGEPAIVDITIDIRHAVFAALQRFWATPTPAEVKYWGSYPVEPTLTQEKALELAEPISLAEIARQALSGQGVRLRREHSWPHGAARRSSFPVRATLKLAWRIRSEMPRLRRRSEWLRSRLRGASRG